MPLGTQLGKPHNYIDTLGYFCIYKTFKKNLFDLSILQIAVYLRCIFKFDDPESNILICLTNRMCKLITTQVFVRLIYISWLSCPVFHMQAVSSLPLVLHSPVWVVFDILV